MPHKKVIEDGYGVKEAAFLLDVNYQTTVYVIKILKKRYGYFKKRRQN